MFDFDRGEVVDVARTFGGNPHLHADHRRVLKLGATIRPIPAADLNVLVEYLDTRIDDAILPVPLANATIEAALPERFSRDAAGRLTAIDSSPLTSVVPNSGSC